MFAYLDKKKTALYNQYQPTIIHAAKQVPCQPGLAFKTLISSELYLLSNHITPVSVSITTGKASKTVFIVAKMFHTYKSLFAEMLICNQICENLLYSFLISDIRKQLQ